MLTEIKPRIRMFAGPNGSGKSKLKSSISTILGKEIIGIYVNPDEIEGEARASGFVDLKNFSIETTKDEFKNYVLNSVLLKKNQLEKEAKKILFNDQKLGFSGVKINSYFSSVIADFIRQKLLQKCESFSFETVMSSEDKIEFLKKAKQLGYKTYLYFIATKDPSINISRVKFRVSRGGHDVPEEKIISRYYRSLDLLPEAIKNSWRAYIFDNSVGDGEMHLVAETKDGEVMSEYEDAPNWWIDRKIEFFLV